MWVFVALHAVLFPAWLITFGLGVRKAALLQVDDTARLSDLHEVSDQGGGTLVRTQPERVNAP